MNNNLAASLVGVIVFLRKQSLVGETLSHASYPGVILGVLAAKHINMHPIVGALKMGSVKKLTRG